MPSSESIFTKFIADTLEHEPKVSPQIDPKSQPLGRLLYWLTHHWKKPTITLQNIYQFGPREIRNRKSAIDVAETLAQRGFLLPIQGHRIDRKEWLIVRETEQTDAPLKNAVSKP
jgi:hypothetical protein